MCASPPQRPYSESLLKLLEALFAGTTGLSTPVRLIRRPKISRRQGSTTLWPRTSLRNLFGMGRILWKGVRNCSVGSHILAVWIARHQLSTTPHRLGYCMAPCLDKGG